MSARWFRFYADAMRNPKVARLSDKQFRLWVQLLSIAAENDGSIPPVDDLKLILNRRLDHLLTGVKELLSAGLIDALGDGYEPHNWNKFQYKSDTSNERVARHRAKRNVTVTAPDTETESEDNTDVLSQRADAPEPIPAKPKSQSFDAKAIDLPSDIPRQDWDAFVDMRKSIRKPIKTEGGANGIVTELRRLAEDGYPPGHVLRQSIAFEYQGVFPLKTGRVNNGNGTYHHRPEQELNPMVKAVAAEKARLAGEQSSFL